MSTADPATVVQLSDIHLVGGGGLLHDAVDPDAQLRAALDVVESSGLAVDALILTGDLTDTGAEDAYRRLRALVDPVADRLGALVVPVVGNHDDRAAFRRVLGVPGGPEQPCDLVVERAGLRVVALDSTVPGRAGGALRDEQLTWLADVLAVPAARGTVLALHHPPIESPIAAVRAMDLADPARLGTVVAGTDVRIVLCGHAHHASAGSLAGVPVWIGPATSYRGDVLAPPGVFRGVTGGALTRVDVRPEGTVATVVPLDAAAVVHSADEADMVALFAGAGR